MGWYMMVGDQGMAGTKIPGTLCLLDPLSTGGWGTRYKHWSPHEKMSPRPLSAIRFSIRLVWMEKVPSGVAHNWGGELGPCRGEGLVRERCGSLPNGAVESL